MSKKILNSKNLAISLHPIDCQSNSNAGVELCNQGR